MKISVIYDSKTGNTRQAADWIAVGMNKVENVEAKAFLFSEADEDFVKESKGVVIGSPSYAASLTPALHEWILNSSGDLELAGKMGGAFATQQYTHGGGTVVIQSILTLEMVKGMLCYSSGGAYGQPYIHLGPVGVNSNKEQHNALEHYKEYFEIYGNRFAQKAVEIFG